MIFPKNVWATKRRKGYFWATSWVQWMSNTQINKSMQGVRAAGHTLCSNNYTGGIHYYCIGGPNFEFCVCVQLQNLGSFFFDFYRK